MAISIKYNSPVILTFAIACSVLFLINDSTGRALDGILVLTPDFQPQNPRDYLNLFTYVLGHANWAHLMGNMTFVLLLGPVIEEKYGSLSLFFMMAVTAFATGLVHRMFFGQGLMGASGIVFMFIILVSFTNVHKGVIPLTFILVVVLFIGKEIMNSFDENQVSEFAHIAGGIIGSLFGFIGNRNMSANHNNNH